MKKLNWTPTKGQMYLLVAVLLVADSALIWIIVNEFMRSH